MVTRVWWGYERGKTAALWTGNWQGREGSGKGRKDSVRLMKVRMKTRAVSSVYHPLWSEPQKKFRNCQTTRTKILLPHYFKTFWVLVTHKSGLIKPISDWVWKCVGLENEPSFVQSLHHEQATFFAYCYDSRLFKYLSGYT